MTEEQIKQNAERYATDYYIDTWEPYVDTERMESFMAGARSTKGEIESLQKQLHDAATILKDIYEDDDYFCTRLCDIPEEEKICSKCCENLKVDCVLRYLKNYDKLKGK